VQDFKRLTVWEKAHNLTLDVYRTTDRFPKQELFGLTSQLRHSAGSVGADIAEGCGGSGSAELARFLQMAMGSANELEYHLLLAHDLEFLGHDDHLRLSDELLEVKRMLASIIGRLSALNR
jgi:four helix bundle protein